MKRIALLIPSYNPEENLLALIDEIKEQWQDPIVVVDDGSDNDEAPAIFQRAEDKGCVVSRHAVNLGKGRALKTGFNECLTRWDDLVGVITADADGQHLPKDIVKCRKELERNPEKLVLGVRDFSAADIPLKSELGNKITRTFMRLFCGVSVSDTQTGLRGVPRKFMMELMSVSGERYEFETNMLLETRIAEVDICQVTIETVYLNQNRASHFRPLLDSVRIYGLLLKFCVSSLMGFVVDISAFAVLKHIIDLGGEWVWSITVATVLARILSACVNYALNKKMVFESKKKVSHSAPNYVILCIVQMMASAALVTGAQMMFPISSVLLKTIVDFVLFFISFQIQRKWVF